MPVQDTIHGYIRVGEMEEALMDTPPVQRLRRVRQLGFTHLVYPCATHSRFEHSLGVMHLAGRFAEALGLSEGERKRLRAAALLHDTGHTPFSHALESLFTEEGLSHEDRSVEVVRSAPVADVLEAHGVAPDAVCRVIRGEGPLGSILADHVDVDRMDYLMRDAYYTGVAYGTIEADTLIRSATRDGGEVVFDADYLSALESMLTARYLMLGSVYHHRSSRIADRMCLEAVDRLREAEDVATAGIRRMDDAALRCRLRGCDASRPMITRIDERRLYKQAARFPLDAVEGEGLRARIAEAADVPREAVLVDEVAFSPRSYDVQLETEEGRTTLDELSPVSNAVQDALTALQGVSIYAAPAHREAVAAAAERMGAGT